MLVQAKIQLYIPCPCCTEGSWRADHLSIGFKTTWTCESCRNESAIERVSDNDFNVTWTGKKAEPVTVTLRSTATPHITLKLNTWKYAFFKDTPWDEYVASEEYFYNEHTCPTNWVNEIVEIEFKGDHDPHGVFEFVDVVRGHFSDPERS